MIYEYGVEYETNGKKPDLPDDVLVEVYHNFTSEWLPYNRAGVWVWGEYTTKFRIVDERYKPKPDESNWHERGDLPPVGTECEMARKGESFKAGEVLFYGEHIFVWRHLATGLECTDRVSLVRFRPLPTERDVLVGECVKALGAGALSGEVKSIQDQAELLVDKGWRPVKPMTEDEFVEKTHDYLPDAMARTAYRAGCRFIEQGE